MAMLRHLAAHDEEIDARLLVSARGWDDVLYREELGTLARRPGVRVAHTLTRATPPGWHGFARRVDADMLREVGPPPAERPHVFVCGPTPFVERVADLLVGVGHPPATIRAERFGPTGG
jgi:ferredoxin-NADP reductase